MWGWLHAPDPRPDPQPLTCALPAAAGLVQVCEKCDVWSMGVVMWEMVALEVPFQELSAQQVGGGWGGGPGAVAQQVGGGRGVAGGGGAGATLRLSPRPTRPM